MPRNTKADRQFFRLAAQLESSVDIFLDELIEQTIASVNQNSKLGLIVDEQAFNAAFSKHLDKFMAEFTAVVIATQGRAALIKLQALIDEIIPKLNKARLATETVKIRKAVANYDIDIQKRFQYNRWVGDGHTWQHRITTIRVGTEKTVRNIVAVGVREEKSARAIAKEIQRYLKPAGGTPVSPIEVARKRFGKLLKTAKPSGSLQYNAMRIARTETAHTYRQATVDFYKDKPYIKGFRWVLSNRHPDKDECDDFAKTTYSRDGSNLPRPHPNCLCDIQAIVMTQAELDALSRSILAGRQ